jgi:two-component system chemotaxis response regulator CheB
VAFQIVVVGTSMGGLQALETVLQGLPATFPLPVAVVQHRSARSGGGLTVILQRYSQLRVQEPNDKQEIRVGHVYIAPPDYHLLVEPGTLALSTEGPVRHARPSIDVLFETASDAYGAGVIGVVLTGASADGSRGATLIQERGGFIVVQEPESAESALMPRSAIAATHSDCILPLAEIAPFLVSLCSYVEEPLSGVPAEASSLPPSRSDR